MRQAGKAKYPGKKILEPAHLGMRRKKRKRGRFFFVRRAENGIIFPKFRKSTHSEILTLRHMERHALEPFLPPAAELLMLGSFPPPRSKWCMDFYYPNPINDMWRIFGIAFFNDQNRFVLPGGKGFDADAIRAFLTEKGIAVGDTARAVVRTNGNASDKFLEVAERLDLAAVLPKIPRCRAVAVTGQKALETFAAISGAAAPKIGDASEFEFSGRKLLLFRMPSSSRAYPKPLAQKAAIYAEMFKKLNLL